MKKEFPIDDKRTLCPSDSNVGRSC